MNNGIRVKDRENMLKFYALCKASHVQDVNYVGDSSCLVQELHGIEDGKG
jgi:hypothetical protein